MTCSQCGAATPDNEVACCEERDAVEFPDPQRAALYPGPWTRLGASLIDGVLLVAVCIVISFVGNQVAASTLDALLAGVYFTALIATRDGQTLGNRAVLSRVVDATTGRTPSVRSSFIRSVALLAPIFVIAFVTTTVPLVGLLALLYLGGDAASVIWSPRRQTVHDKLAGTVVQFSRPATSVSD